MNEDINHIKSLFSHSDNETISKKVRKKRQHYLLQLPLFTLIYQRKGETNFHQIAENIQMFEYDFGFNIFHEDNERKFVYIIKGAAMMFVTKMEANSIPMLLKRIGPNDYFGEKSIYNNNLKLQSVKSVSKTFVLELELETFCKTFSGYFRYNQLKEKVSFLKEIWVFESVSRLQIERILHLSKTIKYKKGTVLFKPRQQVTSIFIILEGQLTLFNEGASNIKYEPFMILGKSQVCGVEELTENQNYYSYGAACITEFTMVLVIKKHLAMEILSDKINKETCKKRNSLKEDILESKSKQSLKKILTKIKLEREKQKQPIMHKRNFRYEHIRSEALLEASQPIYKIQPSSISRVNRLKHPSMREYELSNSIKEEKRVQSQLGLSAYTNGNFTNDKQLLLNYLIRKEKKEKRASSIEYEFQKKKFYLVKEFSVEKSSAVKNQKRKLKNSRKYAKSVPAISSNPL